MRNETAIEIGTRIGLAIARDVLTEGCNRDWTGMDPQDADQLLSAGIEPDTEEWIMAECAAKCAYADSLIDEE